jgi:hypothetical protein
MTNLSRLERVDLRDIWRSEAQDFTPWLARDENIQLLGDTLGIELEVEAVEKNVGPFRADILCQDTTTQKWVLVENQLERTDHSHLGQLITYAAGLDAVTIIWIAARFSDEHRAACDWLNEITKEEVRFFALEVELWRIGDSPAAPKFNVISSPNDWSRRTASAKKAIETTDLTPTKEMQLRYWTGVQDLLASRKGPVKPVRAPAYTWLSHGIGKTGVGLNLAMNTRENSVRVEIYLSGRWATTDYAQLFEHSNEINSALDQDVDWQELPEKQDSRICATLNADLFDEADWPRQHDWIVQTLTRFHEVFAPYVARIERKKPVGSA